MSRDLASATATEATEVNLKERESGEWRRTESNYAQAAAAKGLAFAGSSRPASRALDAEWNDELAWAWAKYGSYATRLLPFAKDDAEEEAYAVIGLALFEVAQIAAQALDRPLGSAPAPPATHEDGVAFDVLFKSRIRALARTLIDSRKVVPLQQVRHPATPSPYAAIDELIDRARPARHFVSNLRASAPAYRGPRAQAYLVALVNYASQTWATSMTELAARGEGRTEFICAAAGIKASNEYRYFSEARQALDDKGRLRIAKPQKSEGDP